MKSVLRTTAREGAAWRAEVEDRGPGGRASFRDVPIDEVAAFWNARPCNFRHSPKEAGTREYFDEVEARKYFVEPHILRFADFPRWQGKRVLEIGCGIGTDTINFARHGARVTAVELSEASLALARRRAAVYGLEKQVSFHAGDAERLSAFVPRDAYDLIYSFGVIHHSPHPERILDELRSYARPGTVVKIMVYHRHSWKALEILCRHGRGRFWALPELLARHSEAQTGCPVTYTYTRREARRLLEAAGFRVTELRADHIFPFRIPDYVEYRYNKVWYFRALPGPVFRGLERALGWHLCVTAVAP